MPLDIFNNEKYQSQDYDTKLKVADNYFKQKIETSEKFKSLDAEKQAMVKDKYFADNVGMPETSFKDDARDFGMQLGTGVGTVVRGVGDTYGFISGDMDNKFSKMGKAIEDNFRKEYSTPFKQLEKVTQKEVDKEVGEWNKFLKTVEVSVENPALARKYIVESIPMLVATRGTGTAAKVITGSMKWALNTTLASGAIFQGADMGRETYDTMMKLDDNYWNNVPEYQEALKNGIDPLKAKNDISVGISRVVGGASGLLSFGTNKYLTGGDYLEKTLIGQNIGKGVVKGGVVGGFGEAGTEVIEEGGGKFSQNLGVQQVNPNQPTLQGVGQASGTALVSGGAMGTVAGATNGLVSSPQQQTQESQLIQQQTQPQVENAQPQPKTADEILATPMKDLIAEAKQSKIFGDSKAKSEAMAVDVGQVNYDIPQEAKPQQMDNTVNVSQTLDNKDTKISNKVKNSISKFNNEDDFVNTSPKMGAKSVSDILGYIDQNTNGQLNFDEVRNSIGETKSFFKDKINIDNLNIQDADIVANENIDRENIDLSKPIVVDAKGNIVDGRHRVVFAKQNGITELDAYIPANMFYQKNANQNTNQNPPQQPDNTGTLWDDNYVAKLNEMEQKAKEAGNNKAVFEIAKEKAKVEELLFSKQEQDREANLKEWHKDSSPETKNADGTPKVFYHGTSANFDTFEIKKAQDKEGRKRRLGWGKDKFYFADSGEVASVAAEYAQIQGKGKNPNVMPVYLNIKKPISADEYMAKVNTLSEQLGNRDRAISTIDKELKKQGIDGIVDTDSGGYAVFNPTQIKSVNNKGSFDKNNPNLLLSESQEDVKDLMVQHNLSEKNLKYVKKRNGLLVPSLAITKEKTPLTEFGEITLLGDKDLVNPKGYAKTKVFGADIYSPRHPRATVDYKPADIRKMDKDLEPYSKDLNGYGDIRTSSDVSNLKDNVAMKMKFLNDTKGYDIKLPTLNEADENLISKTFPDEYKKSIENKGIDVDTLINDENFRHKVIEDFKKTLDLVDGNHDKINTFTPEQIDRIIKHKADNINKIGRDSGKLDFVKLRQTVTDEVNKYGDEFDDYVNNFTSQFESKSYFYDNNTKKAFNEANVIKAMTKNLRGGENFNYGAGSVRAMVTPEFKTLEQIKKAKEKLVTPEDFKPIAKSIEDELLDIATSIAAKGGNQFINNDIAIEFIQDYSKRGRRAIPDYDVDVNNESLKRIDEFLNKLKEMPTEYFEAKITRDVSPAEFRVAVVPENVSKETLDYLTKQGLKIKTYKKGDETDRKRAISEAIKENDLLFSQFKQKNSTTVAETINQAKKLLGNKFNQVTKGIEFLQSANELPKNIKDALYSIFAYHGTPHNVDSFSTKYIGTGEGAQAYGWGMYFADSKAVAEWYRDNLSKQTLFKDGKVDIPADVKKELNEMDNLGFDSATQAAKEIAANPNKWKNRYDAKNEVTPAIDRWINENINGEKGNLYQIELKPKEEEYLLWDKPMSEQSLHVKKMLEKKFSLPSFNEDFRTAGEFYKSRERKYDNSQKASQELNDLGIKGIKYLDGNSRNGEQENYNYVIFADENVGTPELLMSGGIPRGIFDPKTNKIYLIADTMKANEVQGVILHELLHRAINGMVKNGQSRLETILGSGLKPLTDRLNQLASQGDKRVKEAFKRVKDANVPKENQLEETMTYLLENYTNDKNNSNALNRWIKDTIQAIKDFIRKVAVSYGIEPNWFVSKMNVDDIATVLRNTAINGKENLTKDGILASKKSRLEEWHKDSHPLTKNEDGTPKVFYHQTSKEAAKSIYSTKFDINKVGARGSDNAVPDGFFFKTNDNDIGVGTSTKENIEQMPVYLKIKNPFMVKDRNSLKWQISVESKRYKNLLDEAKQIDNHYGKINDELEAQAKEAGYKLRADKENKKLTDEYYAISDKLDENLTSWEDAINKNAELSRKEIKDTLQRLGYDGLNLANDEGSFGRKVNTFIAFEPTQIKSVNNQGTFDETNPNILYSKQGYEDRHKTKLEKLKKWAKDKVYDIANTKGISSLLYVTTRQEKVDMFADITPELQVYDDLVESKLAEANRIAKLSGEIAEKTRKWAVKNKAEADKLFKFMGETTISGIDPTKTFKEQKQKAEQFYTYADKVGIEYDNKDRAKLTEERYNFVKAKWDNLSPEAKEIYSTMKDHYERLADKMFIALKNKITEAEIDENSKVKLIDKLRLEFENRKVSGPYFPLVRFGEYVVTGKDVNGVLVSERYETPSERDNAADEMAKEGYTDIKKSADTDKKVSLQADTAFMSDVLSQIEKANPTAFNDISDSVYQLYLKYLPNMSARKSYIHRKGIQGYSDDMLRVFAAKTFHLGRQIANINHLDKMQKQIDKLEKRVKETGDPKLKAIYDDLLKTHDHIVNPEFAQWQVDLTSLGFYWYMTSLSAGALNLTQVALVVFPKLTGKYGANKSMYNLVKSAKDLTIDNLTQDEKAFMEKMKDSGIIDLTMTHDLAGLGDHYNDIKYGPMTTVKRVLAIPQHYSEVANRMVTLLTTYRLAKDKGITDPTKEAIKINYETNFNYTNENRNRLMRSPAMKVVTQFKNYSVQMLYFMLKHSYMALKGDKEAMKTMGTLIAMSFALSGAKGLPLQLYYLIAGVAGSEDPEDELYANIKEIAGEYTDLVWRGVVNYITGADIGGRTGLNDMLVKQPTREMNTKDTINFYTTQVLGPTLSIFTNFAVGVSDIANGEAGRGIEKTMPKPIKDIIQTYRFRTEGARDYDFKPLVEEFKPYELGIKTIGFQPESLAKVQESNMRQLRVKARIDNERNDILKRLRKADFKGDEKLWQESMQEIREFNAKYPNLAIKNDTIRRSLKGADKDRANAENGLNLPPKYKSETERYK